MKSNLISAIAGWKSAALLALVAMVAAVAFSGVLTNTETADAQAASDETTSPGGKVTLVFTDASDTNDRFSISSASTGTATFTANGSTNIRCRNDSNAPPSTAGCDTNGDEAGVALSVTVDADSPLGEIYVQVGSFDRTAGEVNVVNTIIITVVPADPPTAIQLAGAPPASINMDGSVARNIAVRVVKGNGTLVGGQSLNVVASAGVLETDGAGACVVEGADGEATGLTNGRAFCTVSTVVDADDRTDGNQPGPATVSLFGAGAPGEATVTFSIPAHGLALETNVVIHGPVASITAEAQQSSIQVGGSTNIVITILDSAGNPIPGQAGQVATNIVGLPKITAPETPQSVAAQAVIANDDLDYDADQDRVVDKGDIPACGDHLIDSQTPEDSTNLQTGDPAADVGPGTNSAGQCVINVRAPVGPPAGTDNASATRGTHSVTVVATALAAAADPKEVTVEFNVGGAPASIENDSLGRVDSLSSTKITVTVLDDEGVRVGAVPVSIVQVEGSGNMDPPPGQGTDAGASTSDGRASFTFLAPLSEGEAVFLVRAGNAAAGQQIQDTITVAIGPEAEEVPDAPPATWNAELVSGTHNLVWNGEDGADVADGAGEGVTAIWQWNGSSWDGYFPAAADVPGGNTLDSLSNGAAYWVIVE